MKQLEAELLKSYFLHLLNLLNSIIFHYSKENNYLVPAKECSKFLILKTWHWILSNNLQNRKAVVKEFNKILKSQFDVFGKYFKKTFPVARTEDGLFSEFGAFYEKVGYPLRSFEYLDDIIYYCRLRNTIYKSNSGKKLRNRQKDLIIELINNNSSFKRPILDNHSIPIIQLLLFFSDKESLRQKDVEFLFGYFDAVTTNIQIDKLKNKRLPELHNNIDLVTEFFATGSRPEGYCDSSSILLAILLEVCAIFDSEELFLKILSFIDIDLSLQIVSLDLTNTDAEKLLFEKHLHNEYYVECIERTKDGIKFLKEETNLNQFKKDISEKKENVHHFETDVLGLSCVRYLAHSYFKNEILPYEWRGLIKKYED